MRPEKTSVRWDFWLVLLVVGLSGNQAFTAGGRTEPMLALAALLLGALLLHRRQSLVTRPLHVVVLIFSAIFLLHAAYFYFLPVKTVAGFMVRLFIGCAVVRLVRDFPLTYVRVLSWTAVVSLLFYIPEQLGYFAGFDFKLLFAPLERLVGVPGDYNILIYNFDVPREIHRNSAFFWEPGAFAGYLLLALVLLGLRRSALPTRLYRRHLLILSTALLTTLSTMGYVVLPVVLLLHLPAARLSRQDGVRLAAAMAVGLPLMLLVGYQGWNLDFVKSKIEQQQEQTEERTGQWHKTRFGNLLFDWEYIRRKPLVGWGLHERTRFALHHGQPITGLGNGLSATLARVGAVGFGTWLLLVTLGLWRAGGRSPGRAAIAVAAILLMLNSEAFLNFPLFWGLMFLPHPPRGEPADAEEPSRVMIWPTRAPLSS